MLERDFPVLIQPAKAGFIVRVCDLNGRPLPLELPRIFDSLAAVVVFLHDRFTVGE